MKKVLILCMVGAAVMVGCLSEATSPSARPEPAVFDSAAEFSRSYMQYQDVAVGVRHAWVGTGVKNLDNENYLVTLYDEDQNQITTTKFGSGGLNAIVDKSIAEALIGFFLGDKAGTNTIYKVNTIGMVRKASGGTWGYMIHEIQLLTADDSVKQVFD